MTVGLLGPAFLASIFAVASIAATVAGPNSVVGRIISLAFAIFFSAVAVRDWRRWRHEMVSRKSRT